MVDLDLRAGSLLDLERSLAGELLRGLAYPWEAIPLVAALVERLVAEPLPGYRLVAPKVVAGEGAVISPRAELLGPAVIGPGTEIRTGAFVRENVLVGRGCVVGNSTELKNCILFDLAQAPHFNYVGDSILGAGSHIGAGVILSNFKSDQSEIRIKLSDGGTIATGLVKLGAVLGDGVEIGCNSVCYPGTVVGRRTIVYPLCAVRGAVAGGMILRPDGSLSPKSPGPS
jgi:UDP-N-acetylglucosamine diphosphorylase / glucose-1-phosphate thymidylyltransferase / UDP-N-acetylgalactosamine diphosphorylase / glucosamine-1-phosphate N-acetyltransferase / galactosamine-1-phosphate N-acetyltransferase